VGRKHSGAGSSECSWGEGGNGALSGAAPDSRLTLFAMGGVEVSAASAAAEASGVVAAAARGVAVAADMGLDASATSTAAGTSSAGFDLASGEAS